MNLTPYARYLIAKHEDRTPEEKRRAYKRDWMRRQRAKAKDENGNAGRTLSAWSMTEPSKV